MRQNVRAKAIFESPPGDAEAAVPIRHGPLGHESPAVARRFFEADADRPGDK